MTRVRGGMVATPWGNSDSLREKRLRPGPGTPRDEVLANQRQRLFGAMVASVSERGYLATTVNDLSEISGVSSRTFYDLFPDKKACFLATLEAMIEAAAAYALQSAGEKLEDPAPAGVQLPPGPDRDDGNWEQQARVGFDAFAKMIAAQPAAARLALLEAYPAGPEAVTLVENAAAGFEWLARQMLEQSPERAGMPTEMITAHIGAQQEIARTRLRRGEEAKLPGLVDELWDLLLSYRPPPEPLRLTGRIPRFGPETIDAHDHAERALRAFAVVVAEEGYVNTTVEAVLKRAQMSATTFYTNFHGKEDAMLAAIDSACSQIVAAVLPAFRRAPDWPTGVRAGFGALCNFLASRPAMAQLMAVEIYAAGSAAVERRSQTLQPLEELIGEGFEHEPSAPALAGEAIAGATFTLIYKRLRSSGPGSLPGLAPLLTYITLSPFLGAEEACRIANSDGRARTVA
ncbi:MAG TPA: TetR/AcrR family transcriptional regulator [Solirubrobacterales bacterium]|nr:TetR/AcrR family transcriptional regulator [Solirubrobacterales bacterium]